MCTLVVMSRDRQLLTHSLSIHSLIHSLYSHLHTHSLGLNDILRVTWCKSLWQRAVAKREKEFRYERIDNTYRKQILTAGSGTGSSGSSAAGSSSSASKGSSSSGSGSDKDHTAADSVTVSNSI